MLCVKKKCLALLKEKLGSDDAEETDLKSTLQR
jgi:hypothetical protein